MRKAALAVSVITLLLGLATGLSRPALANSVEVLVNDRPITSYDIEQRIKLVKLTRQGKSDRKSVIDALIEDVLKRQEIAQRDASVSEEKVEQAYGSIASRAKLSPQQLNEVLRRAGINPRTLKDRIRTDLEWNELVRARFRATEKITDRDVARAVEARGGRVEEGSMEEYDLTRVIFVVPSGAGKSLTAQRRREASAFRQRFRGCENIPAQVRGLRDVTAKRIGRRDESTLKGASLDLVKETPLGRLSRPYDGGNGIEMIAVCDKRIVSGASNKADEVRDELTQERGQIMARQYLRDLRSDALIEYR